MQRGPEAVAVDGAGRLYTGTEAGVIMRFDASGGNGEVFANTEGRPLGLAFDAAGRLIVADAIKGLLAVTPDGAVETLADKLAGTRFGLLDDLAITSDGKIYFTEASRKFSPRAYGGTFEAAVLDLMEHGGNGRLLVFDPLTEQTKVLLSDLNFANGLTLSHDRQSLLLTETGTYRVLRYWLEPRPSGQLETVIDKPAGFSRQHYGARQRHLLGGDGGAARPPAGRLVELAARA